MNYCRISIVIRISWFLSNSIIL